MKNKLILGIYILAIVTVLIVSIGVYMMTHLSYRFALIYSLVLSGVLIILTSIIVYMSIRNTGEPFYKKMAFTDMLTGYENRMAFEQRLKACGPIADRGVSVTMIIFDLNTLKLINDTFGHRAGDMYLKNTADMIYQNLGGKAPLYRIGGDEFASIMVGIKEIELQVIMQNFRKEKRMAYKNHPFNCAFGAATFSSRIDKSLRDVFKRADDAMYIEKKRQKSYLEAINRSNDSQVVYKEWITDF